MFMDWKTTHCNILILPKFIFRFNEVPIFLKIAFWGMETISWSQFFIFLNKGPRITKTILKTKVEKFILPDVMTYYKGIVINMTVKLVQGWLGEWYQSPMRRKNHTNVYVDMGMG